MFIIFNTIIDILKKVLFFMLKIITNSFVVVILLLIVFQKNYIIAAPNAFGIVELSGQTDHSNINVKIHVGRNDSTLTNILGFYSIPLDSNPNAYYFSYHKEGYYSDSTSALILNAETELARVILIPYPDTHLVSGFVNLTDSDNSENVSIRIDQVSGNFYTTTSSDSLGAYTIPFIDSGYFTISFSKIGYKPANISNIFLHFDTALVDTVFMNTALIIRGTVLLQGQTNRENIKISYNLTDSSTVDTVITGTTGVFTISAFDTGTYNFTFSKTGYFSESIKNIYIIGDTILDTITLDTLLPETLFHGGLIDSIETWNKRSIHVLVVDLQVSATGHLIIEAGAKILVNNYDSLLTGKSKSKIELLIKGKLTALGLKNASGKINFKAAGPSSTFNTWEGIIFDHADSSTLINCNITNANIGVYTDSSNFIYIKNLNSNFNNYGLETNETTLELLNSTFNSSKFTGAVFNGGKLFIHNNKFTRSEVNGIAISNVKILIFGNNIVNDNKKSEGQRIICIFIFCKNGILIKNVFICPIGVSCVMFTYNSWSIICSQNN